MLEHPLPSTSEADYPEAHGAIAGGLVIPYKEGWEWFKRRYDEDLDEDHSEDLTILWHLAGAARRHGYPLGNLVPVLRQDEHVYEFMWITQRVRGEFRNTGPSEIYVLQDDLKDVVQPGEKEETARGLLFDEFGRWIHVCTSHIW